MSKGNFPYLFFVHKILKNISKSLHVTNMTSWMRISKLYNAVSALVAATRYALAERLQSVRKTLSLLYNRMMDNIGYGRKRLKDIVEKEAEEEEAQEQDDDDDDDDDDEQYDTTPKIKLVYEGKRIKKFRVTRNLNGVNTRMIMANITPHIETRTKLIFLSIYC